MTKEVHKLTKRQMAIIQIALDQYSVYSPKLREDCRKLSQLFLVASSGTIFKRKTEGDRT